MPKTDVIIIGSGIAALAVAEKLCDKKNVIVITKKKIRDCNSNLAQGGIAVTVAKEDSWQSHFEDTMKAGCYFNNEAAVEVLVKNGPIEVQHSMEQGMLFDCNPDGELLLGKEGAHRIRRIVHAGGDQTGAYLLENMIKRVQDKVTIVEDEMALELLMDDERCIGVVTRNHEDEIKTYYAAHTILATGGVGGLYRYSSNAKTITGDGLAMAYRAGCEVEDVEFLQFHPTMLYVNGKVCGLVSEAVRGEGAVLLTSTGERVMEGLHEMADLAPRDVVSRAIYDVTKTGNSVYLDISMIVDFHLRFPAITALCEEHGVSIEGGRIPIVPGAHFHMGGIKTNLNGETSIKNLYAVGEAACQGVHGANRLASNSLLEGLVFGSKLGSYLVDAEDEIIEVPYKEVGFTTYYLPTKEEIQEMMMSYVGIVRSEKDLQTGLEWFEKYLQDDAIFVTSFTNEQLTIYNMLTVGWLIVKGALERPISIGAHYRDDVLVEKREGFQNECIES